ncbi:hypothetical protein JGUZn3_00780 [Entomobacter blattae]|uniref:Uncharacterized protein n=1 Tax=Entomobacter blattae TaxID=2762277 RepID=A0A7H1NNI5_9PROT|nr:hypothetical protein JGUZn3_00780 [Entomobacter blattae]
MYIMVKAIKLAYSQTTRLLAYDKIHFGKAVPLRSYYILGVVKLAFGLKSIRGLRDRG